MEKEGDAEKERATISNGRSIKVCKRRVVFKAFVT